ncbi:MAG: hypothetical protein ABGY95_05575 [Rubritalea sp.]|uniref:hypothetical protein n=1 Tax=Rubritalea sp. TaxID=2109375 RepID=UPI0032425814
MRGIRSILLVLTWLLPTVSSLQAAPDYELQPLEYPKAQDDNGITALRETLN